MTCWPVSSSVPPIPLLLPHHLHPWKTSRLLLLAWLCTCCLCLRSLSLSLTPRLAPPLGARILSQDEEEPLPWAPHPLPIPLSEFSLLHPITRAHSFNACHMSGTVPGARNMALSKTKACCSLSLPSGEPEPTSPRFLVNCHLPSARPLGADQGGISDLCS